MDEKIELFLNFIKNEKKLSDNTFQSYKRDIMQYEEYLNLNNIKYEEINEKDIKNYLDYLNDLNKKPTTISRHLASIRLFYQYLLKNDVVQEDPTNDVQAPKIEKKIPSVLTSEEVTLLLSQPQNVDLKGIRDKAMLEFAYATGMRVTEIISLNIDDVNLTEGVVSCKTRTKTRTTTSKRTTSQRTTRTANKTSTKTAKNRQHNIYNKYNYYIF